MGDDLLVVARFRVGQLSDGYFAEAGRNATRLGAAPTLARPRSFILPFSATSTSCKLPSPRLLTSTFTGEVPGMRSTQQGFEALVSRSSSLPLCTSTEST